MSNDMKVQITIDVIKDVEEVVFESDRNLHTSNGCIKTRFGKTGEIIGYESGGKFATNLDNAADQIRVRIMIPRLGRFGSRFIQKTVNVILKSNPNTGVIRVSTDDEKELGFITPVMSSVGKVSYYTIMNHNEPTLEDAVRFIYLNSLERR